MTSKQLYDAFASVLDEMALPIDSLKVSKGVKSHQLEMEVIFRDNRNIELNYNDAHLRTFDMDEIRALLSHEACHVATLPNTSYLVSSSAPGFYATVIDVYDEFLAHSEFARRFRADSRFKVYRGIKQRDFENYEIVLRGTQTKVVDPMYGIYIIVNDAIYFPVIGDDSFRTWCGEKGVSMIAVFLDWLLEDFIYVNSLGLDRNNAMRAVSAVGASSLLVDLSHLVTSNSIKPIDDAATTEAKGTSSVHVELLNRWKERIDKQGRTS